MERVDTSPQGVLTGGMTESSGVFTFPSTGYWMVRAGGSISSSSNSRYNALYIYSGGTRLAEGSAAITIGTTGSNGANVLVETIIDKGQSCALAPPICAVFGDVVNLHEEIQWFESLPLFGKKLLVTRSREQISSLTNRLESYGADVIEVPTIKIDPLEDYAEFDQIIERLQDFHWIVFTSTNTVEFFLRRVRENGYDVRFLNGVKLAAIGESTAKSLSDKGLIADLVSFKAVSEGLVYEMGKMELKDKQILLPGSNIKRQVISEGLENLGAEVKDILVYRTSHIPDADNRLEEALDKGIEIVTFTSSSTVKGLTKILGGNLDKLSTAKIACIGPVTAAEVQRYGLTVDILAEKSSVVGLVDSIVNYCNSKGLLNG